MQVSTFYGLLKILATMAGGSHVVAEALLQVRMQRGQLQMLPSVDNRQFLLCCWGPYRPTLLTACCSCLGFLVQAGISDTLRNLLATSSLLAAGTVSPGNVLRSAEQVGAACVVRVSCKGRWGAQVVCELHLLLICLRLPGCLTPQSYHPFLFNSWAT